MIKKTLSKAEKPAALPVGYTGVHGGIVELLDAARQAAELVVTRRQAITGTRQTEEVKA